MWEIKNINAQNIISFQDLNYDVEKGVATIIIGENHDDKSQKVNGSGKSAIIEAITIALTGEPLRKVKTDEFISDWSEDASVEITLHNSFTKKDFTISRFFARKAPQQIECHIFDIDKMEEVDLDKTVQASVNDYNKFIMSELGITKDDLFNYYILSSKYESFFESSDRVKKELINKFSNGVLVDQGIEKLEEALVVREKAVVEVNNKVFSLNGSIESLTKEINQAAQKQEEAKKTKEEKIELYKSFIADKRAEIRECNSQIEKADDRLYILNGLLKEVESMQGDDKLSLKVAYEFLSKKFEACNIEGLLDIQNLSVEYANKLKEVKENADVVAKKIAITTQNCQTFSDDAKKSDDKLNNTKSEFEKLNVKLAKEEDGYNKKLDDYDVKFDEIDSELKKYKEDNDTIQRSISSLENVLAGAITCPKCGHEFSISSDKSIDDIKSEVAEKKKQCDSIEKSISELNKKNASMTKEYNEIQDKIDDIDKQKKDFKKVVDDCANIRQDNVERYNNARNSLAELEIKMKKIEGQLQECGQKISNLKADLLAGAVRIISSKISDGETYVKNKQLSISTLNGSVDAYQSSISALEQASDSNIEESLRNSQAEYQKQYDEAIEEQKTIIEKRDKLLEQKQLFLKFKAHLANKKLSAISQIVNKVLEEIGSNIRVDLQGYRVLRTGKLKESISVQLLKNGVECGSFYKFSAGERCRVNLASIIALQRLTNSNCDDGKGLDLLIFDEILDSSDQVGFESYCNTINGMGITSLLITQNSLPENYPYSLTVVKENDMSHILTK